jgi:ABC-type transport system involved in multi-copper enzyme maturation permease subunit
VIAIIRSEWLKLRTTAVPYVLTSISVLFVGLGLLGNFLSKPDNAPPDAGFTVPHTVTQLRNLVGAGAMGYLFAMLLGIMCITTEYRHKTVTTAFLVTPHRWRLVGGKLLTGVLLGVGLGVVVLVATLIGGGLTLVARGGSFSALLHQVPAVAPGLIVAFALFAVLGVGIGAVLTNQVAAIVTSLGWFVIAENILVGLVHGAFKWVPTGAAVAVANLTRGHGNDSSNNFPIFTWWEGGLLLLGYGIVFAIVGSVIMTKRDVT